MGVDVVISATDDTAAWRKSLLDHALFLRAGLLDGSLDATSLPKCSPQDSAAISAGLGPMAEEALRIVEAYVIGTSATERGGAEGGQVPPEFAARLNLILNGLAPATNGAGVAKQAGSVIQSDLWQLLYKVRESAEMAYARELDLVELDRRILFLLHNVGPLVPADIAGAVGVDKAQVSRSVKRLLEIKMVERDQLLLKIDETRATSGVRENAATAFALRAKVARLKALAEGVPFAPPSPRDGDAEERRIVDEERNLYQARQSEFGALLSISQQQLAQRQQELTEMRARRNAAERGLELGVE